MFRKGLWEQCWTCFCNRLNIQLYFISLFYAFQFLFNSLPFFLPLPLSSSIITHQSPNTLHHIPSQNLFRPSLLPSTHQIKIFLMKNWNLTGFKWIFIGLEILLKWIFKACLKMYRNFQLFLSGVGKKLPKSTPPFLIYPMMEPFLIVKLSPLKQQLSKSWNNFCFLNIYSEQYPLYLQLSFRH